MVPEQHLSQVYINVMYASTHLYAPLIVTEVNKRILCFHSNKLMQNKSVTVTLLVVNTFLALYGDEVLSL